MKEILIPLRSNATWFGESQGVDLLKKRIKAYLLLYDVLHIQNGRYNVTVTEKGSFDVILPQDSLNGLDREKIDYIAPGGKAGVSIKREDSEQYTNLFMAKSLVTYNADFFPILKEAGILNLKGIDYFDGDWTDDVKNDAKRIFNKHRKSISDFQSGKDPFLKSKIGESFFIDSLMAGKSQIPIGMDKTVGHLLNWLHDQVKESVRPDVPCAFHNEWISLGLPDFTNLKWEEIIEKRESPIGIDFRNLISRLEETVTEEFDNLKTSEDLRALVREIFVKEIVEELLKRRTGLNDAFINLGLNLTPMISLTGSVADFTNVIKEGRSWINLLVTK